MRCPAALFCALLACIATAVSTDESTRPKRHLTQLKALLNKILLPRTVLRPIGVGESFRFMPKPVLPNVVVPTTPFLKEKVFVNPAPIVRTPAVNLRPIGIGMPPPGPLPCPPLPMVRLPSLPRFLTPLLPEPILLPPPVFAPSPPRFAPIPPPPPMIAPLPPRFAPIPPPPPMIAPLPPRFAPLAPPPVFAPIPPRFPPVPLKSAPIYVPPPPRPLMPVVHPVLPKIIMPSFKYVYDQKNQDGSITTTYSKDGKDVLVVTTDELPKIPPPMLVDRVQKIVTGLPFTPVLPGPIAMGQMFVPGPMRPLPKDPFSIKSYRMPFYPAQPQPSIKTPLVPTILPSEFKNKSFAMGTPLSIPPPPLRIVERLGDIREAPKGSNLGYSFKLNNEEGYLQQGNEKIYYSRLLPSPYFSPEPLSISSDRNQRIPHQYTLISEDKSVFDGIEEGSIRRHHEGDQRPHYGGPRLPTWIDNGYSYKLAESEPDFIQYGNRDDAVTVTRKIVGTPNFEEGRPGMQNTAPYKQTFPLNLDNTGQYLQRYPFLENPHPFGQRLDIPSDVIVTANKHEHIRPDGTKYICYENHALQFHPVQPMEIVRDVPVFGPIVEVRKTPILNKIKKTIPEEGTRVSKNQVINRGSSKYVSSAVEEIPTSDVPKPTIIVKEMPLATPNLTLSKNPIVVLPNEQNFSYKVNKADGSSIDVTGSKDNKVSVKINNTENKRRRGDVSEMLF